MKTVFPRYFSPSFQLGGVDSRERRALAFPYWISYYIIPQRQYGVCKVVVDMIRHRIQYGLIWENITHA